QGPLNSRQSLSFALRVDVRPSIGIMFISNPAQADLCCKQSSVPQQAWLSGKELRMNSVHPAVSATGALQ
ncbi:hypothetical protein, partial [Pseudomonas sp.]|uniref:hypothetical protein n=1 Tax=Pseudomonas sp. TaxID=306 RepID=UPI003F9C4865